MIIRLYCDEDSMQHTFINALRARGVDVRTALEARMTERPDWEHLDYATAEGRVLYSFNVGDFCRLHTKYLSEDKSHAGIVVARQQRFSVGTQLHGLLRLVVTKSAEAMRDQLEFLASWI